MGEYLTITMTERIPVQIKKENWTIIAEAKEYSENYQELWEIKVRTKRDSHDAYIVHGSYINDHPEFSEEIRHGFLVHDINDVPKAIINVQTLIKANGKLAHICTSKLPAQIIV